MKGKAAGFILAFCVTLFAFADVPVRKEEFIYSILAFNGRDYSGTFAREEADTIYLIAGVDNFLTAKKTFVYFWPITGEWRTDTQGLDQELSGTLEVYSDKEQPVKLTPEKYTYYNVRGVYELNWNVAKGKEADKVRSHYEELVDEYWKAISEYYNKRAEYESRLDKITGEITERRKRGEDVTSLLEELKTMKPPARPQPPEEYTVPPVPVKSGFIINLPVGEYRIRFLTPDGFIMQGSEKKIVVFEKRREGGIGYEIIPGDKWTRPSESKTPHSVLYVDGTTDLYLRPFYQDEFNDLYYEKMRRNDSRGNPNLMKWVRMQQVPEARIEMSPMDGNITTVTEEPFYVEQVQGASLGYRIVPFDAEGKHEGREPSIRAFHIPIERERGVLKISLFDREGKQILNGKRQIRVIPGAGFKTGLFLLAFVPLLVMGVVLFFRRKRYSD